MLNFQTADIVVFSQLLPHLYIVHETVIKNEFNSLDDSNTSGRIIETKTGTILTFRQKVHDSSLSMDEVILAKDSTGSFFAERFTLHAILIEQV